MTMGKPHSHHRAYQLPGLVSAECVSTKQYEISMGTLQLVLFKLKKIALPPWFNIVGT